MEDSVLEGDKGAVSVNITSLLVNLMVDPATFSLMLS
jgi:hypothetical protein